MKIDINKLCGIASEHKLLTFIYELDQNLYSVYRQSLLESTGCQQNRMIVSSLIDSLIKRGHKDRLKDFIMHNYPDCVNGYINSIFPAYDPKILTIPHRVITDIDGLTKYINKPICKHLSKDGVVYVEYLNDGETSYTNINWILDNYSDSIVKINI